MKRLCSVEREDVSLEVCECDCGFHMGIDASFLEQVGDVHIKCPSCEKTWSTAVVFSEDSCEINYQPRNEMICKLETLPDQEIRMHWGVRAKRIDGTNYPEQVLCCVCPDFYEDNGEPIFGYPEVEDEMDPRICDGDVMEYIRTVRLSPCYE